MINTGLPGAKTEPLGLENEKFIGAIMSAANRHLSSEYNLKVTDCLSLRTASGRQVLSAQPHVFEYRLSL